MIGSAQSFPSIHLKFALDLRFLGFLHFLLAVVVRLRQLVYYSS